VHGFRPRGRARDPFSMPRCRPRRRTRRAIRRLFQGLGPMSRKLSMASALGNWSVQNGRLGRKDGDL
jgi:hypothetical protein